MSTEFHSARNPQTNAIVKRVHQTISNIIRTFKIQEMDLDDENPWEFYHLLCSPYGLRCTLQRNTHRHNWYLVGTRSLISTRKPTGN